MTDFLLLEKLHGMVSQKRSRRVAFEKGVCAEGFFRPYMSFSEYTRAGLFGDPDIRTPVLARFSSMMGDWGTADTARNIKGLAVKFDTDAGAYDLLCQSLPVFFSDSWEKLPGIIEAMSKQSLFSGIDSHRFWRFVAGNRESINCAIRLYSAQGISGSFVYMNWYTAGTFVWENDAGGKHMVRYRWIPVRKVPGLVALPHEALRKMDRMSAEFMAGYDPDTAVDGLRESIIANDFLEYELQAQIAEYSGDPEDKCLKRTLCWDERIFPPVALGVMRLTDITAAEHDNEVRFAPGNTVPGIELCDDSFSAVSDYICRVCDAGRKV